MTDSVFVCAWENVYMLLFVTYLSITFSAMLAWIAATPTLCRRIPTHEAELADCLGAIMARCN